MNEEFLKNNKHSLEHVHEYIKVKFAILNEKDTAKFLDYASEVIDHDPKIQDKVKKVKNLLERLVKCNVNVDTLKEKAKLVFPFATMFEEKESE